jgi:hypothetical protein
MPHDQDTVNLDVERIQRWMQAVIVNPGDVEQAIRSPEATSEIPAESLGEVVTPSHSMTSAERVDVYHGMYLLRMVEALEYDYPTLKHYLGQESFEELVREYVQVHPSRSYTLNRLGDHLPEYLETRHDWADSGFLADLARFERAITEVFDEAESPVLTAEELQSVPTEAWESARLKPIAAFRLLELKHAVVPHLKAYHSDQLSPRPRRRNTWVAIYRRDFSPLYLELSRAEHDLLRALVDGTSLAESLAAAAVKVRSGQRQEKIFRWFRTWVAEGLFSAVET